MSFLSFPMISRQAHLVAMVTRFVKLPTLTVLPQTAWSSSGPTVKGLGAPRPDSLSCTAVIREVMAKIWGAIFDLRECTVLGLEKSTICESRGISLREPMAKTSHLLGTKNLIQKGRKLTPQATTPASIKTSSPINRKTANQLGWRTGCLFQLITTAMVPISLIGRLQKRPSNF